MKVLFPQLLPYSDAALLCLRLVVAVVFFDSGCGVPEIQSAGARVSA